jgi:hypothetical protein
LEVGGVQELDCVGKAHRAVIDEMQSVSDYYGPVYIDNNILSNYILL